MESIQINYEYSSNLNTIKKWLINLPPLIACDFETSSKYYRKEKELLKYKYKVCQTPALKRRLNQQKESDGLSHPSLSVITHLSIAYSNKDAYVIVCCNNTLRQFVCNYLVSADNIQLWHNTSFDFKHIYYHTKSLPKSYIDTMLLAKSLINDANHSKSLVGLKDLMKYMIGDWSLSKDVFTLEEMWNEDTIRYAATDACLTMKLYEDIQYTLNKWKI